jgi:hypothetical protein
LLIFQGLRIEEPLKITGKTFHDDSASFLRLSLWSCPFGHGFTVPPLWSRFRRAGTSMSAVSVRLIENIQKKGAADWHKEFGAPARGIIA